MSSDFLKNFTLHEEKCIGVDILSCPKCMKHFTNYSNKSKHIRRNTCKAKNLIYEKIQNTPNFDVIVNNEAINKQYRSLILNEIIITSRIEDKYVNANLLCQAGNKIFNDWFNLQSTKDAITELKMDTKIKTLFQNDNKFIWIHPDLAIILAMWISPKFAIQVSSK